MATLHDSSDRHLLAVKKRRARMAVYQAVQRGELIRPTRCGKCGKECKPDAAHRDYDRPLEVDWLCRSCHRRSEVEAPTPITLSDEERARLATDLVPVTIYLPEGVKKRLEQEARDNYQSLASLLRQILIRKMREEGGDI